METQNPVIISEINCLIIDDDRFSRTFIKTALHQIGVKSIKEASSPEDAKEILKNNIIDLIFLDQIMPGKSGIEFAVELKKSSNPNIKNIPIIMITIDSKEKTVLDAKSLGIEDYLVKPVSPQALKRRIYDTLRTHNERK